MGYNSLFSSTCPVTEQGIATYLTDQFNVLWPDLRGLSLLTLGKVPYRFTQHSTPYYHIHGQLSVNPVQTLHSVLSTDPKTCYFTYDQFPFQKCSFDRILYHHHPKTTRSQLNQLLRSCWETLKDDGRVLLMLPNKLKWWGILNLFSFYTYQQNSFSMYQLKTMLKTHMFQIISYRKILFFPYKLVNSFSLSSNKMLELLARFFIPFGGAYHLVEIRKNLYEPITIPLMTRTTFLQKKLSNPNWNRKK